MNETIEDVQRRLEDGVLWITLNRPDAGNAMTVAMRNEIVDWLGDASGDYSIRAVVLTGRGEKGFCTGADIRSGRTPLPEKPPGAPERIIGDGARIIRNGWQRLVASIMDCEKPVIAGVNGTAAGGGMHLALACDLVIMAEEARFIEVFIRRGIAPDAGGAYLLTRLVGPQKAKELFFFGDDIPAAHAEHLGIVNKVVPRAELEKTLEEWAGRLAKAPTRAIGFAKALTNRALETDRAGAFWDEAYAQELVASTDDASEGMASFVERRPPEFKGW
ncbi:MAG TPA: enoyl-CoA hydratase-related protein [Acidimicrobiia bacterium]|jgi:2-(1,2-epoxy-1,2-dihydrophenyl)acetyl-CoA isomerase